MIIDNIRLTCTVFADDTSLFSHVLDKDTLQDEMNYNLQKVSNWVFYWKKQINPDPEKTSTRSDF